MKQQEEKNREYNLVKTKAESEFYALDSREKEMQNRIEKTQNETSVLKAETAEDSSKIIKPDKYEMIGEKARDILKQFGRQEIKKETPVVTILLRIEH